MAGKSGHRGWGRVRKLPSGRWQASYLGPDRQVHKAPETFTTKESAEGWLSLQRADILRDVWNPGASAPAPAVPVFGDYADTWLAARVLPTGEPISPATRRLYTVTLKNQVLPAFRTRPLDAITPVMVRQWYAGLDTGPRQRAQAYSLLRTILNTALADDVITANPCRIHGAASSQRVKKIRPASLPELEIIVSKMPARYQLMVLLAAWCALRFGELAELRRKDIDADTGVVHVRRGIVDTGSGRIVKAPKSAAGSRDVHIPPHLHDAVREHLDGHVVAGPNALMFPGKHGRQMDHSALYHHYYPARAAAGRDDLTFHALRHTGATLAAATGATLAELMARLGHSTVGAAMLYQHAAQDRDKAIAEALSKLATVTPITAARSKQA